MKTNISNVSYQDYLTSGLETLSKNFTIKSYKLACQDEWRGFERGRDIRVQIQWKGTCIWEWILEKTFWIQRNSNKEDRMWMRNHADVKIAACKKAIIKKKPTEKKMKKSTPVVQSIKLGHTQDNFEKMKRIK